jgi:anhydro-N-acetylmuramic acid kinase
VVRAQTFFPAQPVRWLVAGGGRHNPVLMAALAGELKDTPIAGVEAAGWDGDALEAVRSMKDLPLSLPATTGVSRPVSGGIFHRHSGGAVS